MMRSLYSGVAGLKTHQTKMDVIGNNIANVNTTAYKSSSITFSELMSQTTQNASGPNATTGTGGTNAKQIGLGVKSGAINVNVAGQGAAQSTGNPFDIMITGDNFFVVSNGSETMFTRDGSFYVDGAGNLAMTSTGYNVMGWLVDETTGNVKQDNVSALRIMSTANKTYPPEATSKGYMTGIIDKNDTDVTSVNGKVVNLNFYDNLGYSYTAKFTFKQSDIKSEDGTYNYSLELDKILDSTGAEVDLSNATGVLFGDNTRQDKSGEVVFDSTNYKWNGAGILTKNGKSVADVSKMFTNASTAANVELLDRSEKITLDDGSETTVGDMLDEVAKAYGYEGATNDFLNLIYEAANNPADPDAGTTELSVTQMLFNLTTDPSNSAVGAATSLPSFLSATPGSVTSFSTVGRNYEGIAVAFDKNTGYFAGVNGNPTNDTSTLRLSLLGGNFADIAIDLSELSTFDNKGTSTASATSGDQKGLGTGRKLGEMTGVSIQQNGMIYASYDNGMTKLLGQIATAAFANPSGLEKQGDNLYSSTLNSGEFDGIGVDVTTGGGYMSTGQLEMSNVDLSAEFTEMITTQRGFQANSRIITVSDTLLEELTNLKR